VRLQENDERTRDTIRADTFLECLVHWCCSFCVWRSNTEKTSRQEKKKNSVSGQNQKGREKDSFDTYLESFRSQIREIGARLQRKEVETFRRTRRKNSWLTFRLPSQRIEVTDFSSWKTLFTRKNCTLKSV
jgi:hypothetical protein